MNDEIKIIYKGVPIPIEVYNEMKQGIVNWGIANIKKKDKANYNLGISDMENEINSGGFDVPDLPESNPFGVYKKDSERGIPKRLLKRLLDDYVSKNSSNTTNTTTSTSEPIKQDPGLLFLLKTYYNGNVASFENDFDSETSTFSNEDIIAQTKAMLKHVYGLLNKSQEEINAVDGFDNETLWKKVTEAGLHSKIRNRYKQPKLETTITVDDDPYYLKASELNIDENYNLVVDNLNRLGQFALYKHKTNGNYIMVGPDADGKIKTMPISTAEPNTLIYYSLTDPYVVLVDSEGNVRAGEIGTGNGQINPEEFPILKEKIVASYGTPYSNYHTYNNSGLVQNDWLFQITPSGEDLKYAEVTELMPEMTANNGQFKDFRIIVNDGVYTKGEGENLTFVFKNATGYILNPNNKDEVYPITINTDKNDIITISSKDPEGNTVILGLGRATDNEVTDWIHSKSTDYSEFAQYDDSHTWLDLNDKSSWLDADEYDPVTGKFDLGWSYWGGNTPMTDKYEYPYIEWYILQSLNYENGGYNEERTKMVFDVLLNTSFKNRSDDNYKKFALLAINLLTKNGQLSLSTGISEYLVGKYTPDQVRMIIQSLLDSGALYQKITSAQLGAKLQYKQVSNLESTTLNKNYLGEKIEKEYDPNAFLDGNGLDEYDAYNGIVSVLDAAQLGASFAPGVGTAIAAVCGLASCAVDGFKNYKLVQDGYITANEAWLNTAANVGFALLGCIPIGKTAKYGAKATKLIKGKAKVASKAVNESIEAVSNIGKQLLENGANPRNIEDALDIYNASAETLTSLYSNKNYILKIADFGNNVLTSPWVTGTLMATNGVQSIGGAYGLFKSAATGSEYNWNDLHSTVAGVSGIVGNISVNKFNAGKNAPKDNVISSIRKSGLSEVLPSLTKTTIKYKGVDVEVPVVQNLSDADLFSSAEKAFKEKLHHNKAIVETGVGNTYKGKVLSLDDINEARWFIEDNEGLLESPSLFRNRYISSKTKLSDTDNVKKARQNAKILTDPVTHATSDRINALKNDEAYQEGLKYLKDPEGYTPTQQTTLVETQEVQPQTIQPEVTPTTNTLNIFDDIKNLKKVKVSGQEYYILGGSKASELRKKIIDGNSGYVKINSKPVKVNGKTYLTAYKNQNDDTIVIWRSGGRMDFTTMNKLYNLTKEVHGGNLELVPRHKLGDNIVPKTGEVANIEYGALGRNWLLIGDKIQNSLIEKLNLETDPQKRSLLVEAINKMLMDHYELQKNLNGKIPGTIAYNEAVAKYQNAIKENYIFVNLYIGTLGNDYFTKTKNSFSVDKIGENAEADGLFGAITDMRVLLGRDGDYGTNNADLETYQTKWKELGYKLELDPETKYYKLVPLSASAQLGNDVENHEETIVNEDLLTTFVTPNETTAPSVKPKELTITENSELPKPKRGFDTTIVEAMPEYLDTANVNKQNLQLINSVDPYLYQPQNKHYKVTTNLPLLNEYDNAAAETQQLAYYMANNFSDGRLGIGAQLDALTKAYQLKSEGAKANYETYNKTMDASMQTENEDTAYNQKVADTNASILAADEAKKKQVLAAYNLLELNNRNTLGTKIKTGHDLIEKQYQELLELWAGFKKDTADHAAYMQYKLDIENIDNPAQKEFDKAVADFNKVSATAAEGTEVPSLQGKYTGSISTYIGKNMTWAEVIAAETKRLLNEALAKYLITIQNNAATYVENMLRYKRAHYQHLKGSWWQKRGDKESTVKPGTTDTKVVTETDPNITNVDVSHAGYFKQGGQLTVSEKKEIIRLKEGYKLLQKLVDNVYKSLKRDSDKVDKILAGMSKEREFYLKKIYK